MCVRECVCSCEVGLYSVSNKIDRAKKNAIYFEFSLLINLSIFSLFC